MSNALTVPDRPPCDLTGAGNDPDRIRMRVVETLDSYGLHWQATAWWIENFHNRSPFGIRAAAMAVVTLVEPPTTEAPRGGGVL